MKSTELRIGNRIFCNGEITEVGFGIITRMYQKENGVFNAKDYPIFEPIELNISILLKSHLKSLRENLYEWKWNKKTFRLEFYANAFWFKSSAGTTESGPLKYVHELQNLFHALHGEELTLKL